MAENSLFAILLRSPWWVSVVAGSVLGLVGYALVPHPYKVVGALSCAPFIGIAIVALVRQWGQPGAADIERTQQALAAASWPAFSPMLAQAFEREGHTVRPGQGDAFDFELERPGYRTLVAARRWKSARTGVEPLRALQQARERLDVRDAIFVTLAPLSEPAAVYARDQRITVWQAAELAGALRGQALPSAEVSGRNVRSKK